MELGSGAKSQVTGEKGETEESTTTTSATSSLKCQCGKPATVVYIPRGRLPRCYQCDRHLYFVDVEHPGRHSRKRGNAVLPLCSRYCDDFTGVLDVDTDNSEEEDDEDKDEEDEKDEENLEGIKKEESEQRMIVGGDDKSECGYCGVRNMFPSYKAFERDVDSKSKYWK